MLGEGGVPAFWRDSQRRVDARRMEGDRVHARFGEAEVGKRHMFVIVHSLCRSISSSHVTLVTLARRGLFRVLRVVHREADVVRVRRHAKTDTCAYARDDPQRRRRTGLTRDDVRQRPGGGGRGVDIGVRVKDSRWPLN